MLPALHIFEPLGGDHRMQEVLTVDDRGAVATWVLGGTCRALPHVSGQTFNADAGPPLFETRRRARRPKEAVSSMALIVRRRGALCEGLPPRPMIASLP